MAKRLLVPIVFLSLSFTSLWANINDKVIYGDDNRLDISYLYDSRYVEWASASASMVDSMTLFESGDDYILSGRTLEDKGVCSSERFSDQMSAATCSGFLVAEDLLVTAGHCIEDDYDCSRYQWVFDYKDVPRGITEFEVPRENVYSCKKIVSRKMGFFFKNDYAVIKLDRAVKDRTPLKINTGSKVQVGDPLVVIGNPSGLPLKVAGGAKVLDKKWQYFKADLDSFAGNSGSVVINDRTGLVEGILVRGEKDYVLTSDGCLTVNRCNENNCSGEEVTYIKNLKNFIP